MSAPRLSIVIPAYKESDRIGDSLSALAGFLKSRKYGEVEVVVVAQDPHTHRMASLECKHHKGFRSIELKDRAGKGGAVRIGMYEAKGTYKLFMDADLATPLKHLDDVFEFIERGGDIAIAVRNINLTHTGVRKFISEFGNLLTRLLLTPGIKDTQCGFKVFESDAASQLFGRQKITGWAFDMELLAIARKLKYKVDVIKADDWHDPKSEGLVGDSNAKAALESGLDMLKIKWRLMTGQYKRISYHHEPL
jgi:dolichyl-phosphate beta-glucosyltransferase